MIGFPYHRRALIDPVEMRSSAHLTVQVEDWSDVRSHGRARRRRRLGHAQRIAFRTIPDPKVYTLPDGMMVAHPVTLDALAKAIGKKIDAKREAQFMDAYFGRPI